MSINLFKSLTELDEFLKSIGWEVVPSEKKDFLTKVRNIRIDSILQDIINPNYSYTIYEINDDQYLTIENDTGKEIGTYVIKKTR